MGESKRPSDQATGPPGPAPQPSIVPPAPKRTASGKHPAVQVFREKLGSIADGVGLEGEALDAELQRYLQSIRTPVPPPDSSEGDKDP